MSEVVLAFDCPVYVHVDTEAGEVTKVVVADEAAGHAGFRVVDEPELDSLDEQRKLEAHARQIATAEDWPAWSFGH